MDSIYCAYCPDTRPAMSQRSLLTATYCTNCGAAFHQGCIKRCHKNENGSIQECCGIKQAENQSQLSYSVEEIEDISQPQNYSLPDNQADLSNNQLKDILLKEMKIITSKVTSFNTRLSKNEKDEARPGFRI